MNEHGTQLLRQLEERATHVLKAVGLLRSVSGDSQAEETSLAALNLAVIDLEEKCQELMKHDQVISKPPLEQVEWRAKDILKSINKFRSKENNEEKKIYLGVLKNDIGGLREAWESIDLSLDPPE